MVGRLAGRHAYFGVEGDRHHGNEYLVLVGPTAKGRKGTSWGRALNALVLADRAWEADHIISLLATGDTVVHVFGDATGGPLVDNRLRRRPDAARAACGPGRGSRGPRA